MRKKPVRHQVKAHKRNDNVVHSYTRGHGIRMQPRISSPVLKNWNRKPEGYSVTFTYTDKPHDIEKLDVIATSYDHAIDEAFKNKTDIRMPIEISVVDPSLKEVIHWVGSKAKEYGTKAFQRVHGLATDITNASLEHTAKGAGFGASIARKQLVRRQERSVDSTAQKLIKQAYGTNEEERVFARAKLRKDYPMVWGVMDISRSKTV